MNGCGSQATLSRNPNKICVSSACSVSSVLVSTFRYFASLRLRVKDLPFAPGAAMH